MSKEMLPASLSGTQPVAFPGVSVVIPAYNYAIFLRHAIDSALAQDYTPLEIIIVDDGSTDNTADIAARYGERVRYIYQQNAGLSAARNTGIRAARHSFLTFLDADDAMLPGMLRQMMEALVKLGDHYGLVACNARYMDADGKALTDRAGHVRLMLKEVTQGEDVDFTAADILVGSRFGCTVIARRAAFDDCGLFDTTLRSSEDRDMWIRIATRHRVHRLGAALVQYRRHGSNMSRHADRMKTSMGQVIRKSRISGVAPAWRFWFWMKVYSFYHFQTSLIFSSQGRYGVALKGLCLSLLLWPWFLDRREINQQPFFRGRALKRHIHEGLGNLFSPNHPVPPPAK